MSLSIPTGTREWIAVIYFSFRSLSYRLWRGHIDHLIMSGRIRGANSGSRMTLRQAAILSLFHLASLPVATLMVIPVPLLLLADGDKLGPLVSWTVAGQVRAHGPVPQGPVCRGRRLWGGGVPS